MEKRTIKFRFWTPDKRMLDDHEGWVEGIGINEALKCSRDYGYIAMQFTGLKDKNGKEIYEGDIVRCGYGTGSIIFHAACFMIEWIDDVEADMEFVFSRKGRSVRIGDECLEIIGNLYQNPELITSNKTT